jgi:hypothetical protein
MAIRRADRVSALALLVPLAYKPPTQSDSAPLPPWIASDTAVGKHLAPAPLESIRP